MRTFGLDQRQEFTETAAVPPAASRSMPPQATPYADRKIAVLGPTLRFKGELSAEEDFILQGRIEGSINHTQSVTIGADGSVLGNIHARVVTIDGLVEGDLHGSESVVVHATGRVTGNIFAPRVALVDGAFFNGRIDMGSRPALDVGRAPGRVEAKRLSPGVPMSPEETERMLGAKP
jgi:cytoskeletal protein CcmA (bactofilin family)